MSGARKFSVAVALVFATLVLGPASALAQMGGPSPSGGTSLRQTVEEGSGPVASITVYSGGGSIDLRSWLLHLVATRSYAPAPSQPLAVSRTLAVVQRRIWHR